MITENTPEHVSLPPFSSFDEVVSFLKQLPVGETFHFQCKQKNLDEQWTNTKAVKGESFFEIVSDVEGSLPHKVPFDDEAQSILSLNLWEIGWFRVLPSTASDTTPVIVDIPAISFGGKHLRMDLNGANYDVYQQVTVGEIFFNHSSFVEWDDQLGIFFFGAEPIGETHEGSVAIVYNCTKHTPELIDSRKLKLVSSECGQDIDVAKCKQLVREHMKTIGQVNKSTVPTSSDHVEHLTNDVKTADDQTKVRELEGNLKIPAARESRRGKIAKQQFSPPMERRVCQKKMGSACSLSSISLADTQPNDIPSNSKLSNEIDELKSLVKSLTEEVKELKNNQTGTGAVPIQPSHAIHFPPPDQAFLPPTPMQTFLHPSLPNMSMPQTESNSVHVARMMLASQFMGMMSPFFNAPR